MQNMKRMLMSACLVAAACGGQSGEQQPETPKLVTQTQGKFLTASEPIPGEYVVVLKGQPGPTASDIDGVAASMATAYAVQVTDTYGYALRGFSIQATQEKAQALANDPNVAYVQQNGVVRLTGTQTTPIPFPWGLDRIDQEALPLNNQYAYDTEAANVHAYILDTGIRSTHTEFEGRATRDFDIMNDGMSGDDCNGHGTHVAGTVGGKQYGVAKKVRLHGVRVLGCGGTGSFAGVIAGVDWVTANAQRPAVANLSLTGSLYQALDDAITNSVNAGIVYVVAAGNSTADACNYSPARTPGAITVGATTNTDWRATFSNWGACLDIFAPGDYINSAWFTGDNDTRTMSGTSMAAPHVAGAAALLLAKGVPAGNVPARLVGDSTPNLVTNANAGSPNRLLFTGSRGTALNNGVAVNVGDTINGVKNFYLDVPAGAASVTFTISGGTGDADLYVRHNNVPTPVEYDCRPMRAGNNEICTMPAPQPGRWYAQLRAYRDYANVSLKGQY